MLILNKETGDTLTAVEWNQVPDEIQNAIVSSGGVLSASNFEQLALAISNYSVVGDFYSDSGTIANDYLLSPHLTFKPITGYIDGMQISFFVSAANVNTLSTGTVEITTVPAGPKSLFRSVGSTTPLEIGDVSGFMVVAYDLNTDSFGIVSQVTQKAAGSSTEVQFNTGGFFDASSDFFFDGTNVGIGSGLFVPGAQTILHVFAGTANVGSVAANTLLTLEDNSAAFLSLLAPTNGEKGIIFGETGNDNIASIIYDGNVNNGFEIRANNSVALELDDTGIEIKADGTAAIPAIRINNANTGIFGIAGSDVIAFSANSINQMQVDQQGLLINIPGSQSAPSIRMNDANTGIFSTTNTINFSAGGVQKLIVDTDGIVVTDNGNAGTPALRIASEDSGFFFLSSSIRTSIGGTEIFQTNAEGIEVLLAGTAIAPAIRLNTGLTGIYQTSVTNTFSIAFEGVQVAEFGSSIIFPEMETTISGVDLGITTSGRLTKTISSKRYKRDIQPIDDSMSSKIYDMDAVTYKLKEEDIVQIGFIAEQLDEIGLNELVFYKDYEGEDGLGNVPESVHYARVTALLVHEMKKLRSEIDELKSTINK